MTAQPDFFKRLVKVEEMANILQVPRSWLYERTRQGQAAIPHIKFGKYVRFDPEVVIQHFKFQENKV